MLCAWRNCPNSARKSKYRGHTPKYCSRKCQSKAGVHILRTKRKREAVAYLGGKCMKCGYKRHLAALQFHHRNPRDKKFNIHKGITLSMDRVKSELDKCDLLCANCHMFIHSLGS